MTLALLDEAVLAGAGLGRACEVVGLSSRCVARWRADAGGEDKRKGPLRAPPQKLSETERATVLAVANEPRFRDLSPKQIVPLLADEGRFVASESTFYRVLREAGQLTHRGAARAPQHRPKAEHIATGRNQLWSWDITYLRSELRGAFFYLYMVVDVWSRKIVGFTLQDCESTEHASDLLASTYADEKVTPGSLVLHADNGGPMKGATLLATLQRLGVATSYSRPSVSDDNPFSEALFRTLKYRPNFPRRPFRSIDEARVWVSEFVRWYNTVHLHSALRFVTPSDRHAGRETAILAARRRVYTKARKRSPERWSRGTRNWTPVGSVALNPVRPTVRSQALAQEVK